MSKALKRLTTKHLNYDLSMDIMSTGKAGEIGVKAVLTIFKPADETGKPGTTERRTVGIGVAADLKTAKETAINDALLAAGV